jgi:hypothetical protein
VPCRCDDYYEDSPEGWLRQSLNELTRFCCDMRTILRRHGLESELCAESREWIREHDYADAMRIKAEEERGERERMKQAALDKLTMDERRMLGL